MRKLTHMLLAGTLILACSSCGVETTANYQVIPCLLYTSGGCFFGNAVLLVEHQQGVVQIGHISYQRSADGLFVLQALKVERFGTCLLYTSRCV